MPTVTREDLDALNTIITVELPTSDYLPEVNKQLKDYRKKVQIKGFRQGNVPMGMIKRKFGTNVLVEKINERVNKELDNYFKEEKIGFLGDPMPIRDEGIRFDINKPQDYNFRFKLGLIPEFDIQGMDADNVLPFYDITVTDEMLNEEKDQIQKRFGEGFEENVMDIRDEDVILVDLEEMENGEIKEGGVSKERAHLLVRQIPDAELKDQLYTATVEDSFDVDVYGLETGDKKRVHKFILDIPEEQEINSTFRMTIKHIQRVKRGELNEALFQKVFPNEEEPITTVEAFEERLRDEIYKAYRQQSRRQFYGVVHKSLMDLNNFELPDAFLKEWLVDTNKVKADVIEAEYADFATATRWSLIRDKVANENEIEVTRQDISNTVRGEILRYLNYQMEPFNPMINQMVDKSMEDENVVRKHFENLLNERVLEHVAELVGKDMIAVTKEEFEAKIKAEQEATQEEEVVAEEETTEEA
ncbi:MAG: hypothetical protein MK212_01110 [Saprospiraceae bacterium]|nr:hypothetical protein [Saprospiraceae bacterium]